MSLTGILLDVSASMQRDIGNGIDEEGGPWAHSIFKVIDDLIEHDLTSENRVFAMGVGASCTKQIFDIIGTLQKIENMEMPSFVKNAHATRQHIDEILDILQANGARNIRQWVQNITFIEDVLSDYMAALVMKKLQSDREFVTKFVHEFLPSSCRDTDDGFQQIPGFAFAENWAVWGVSRFRSATREDIHAVVEKAKCYFLKDAGTHSVFSVQEASRIIRGCVDENKLSTERKKELLENVEPFIYGHTPLYESLEEATKLFKRDPSENKLLFVLSDGDPTDGRNDDSVKIKQMTSKLSGVKVVSCFVTRSTDIHPKRLYDNIQPDWESGAKFLFLLSSQVPTQHLPRAILAKRGWSIDIVNNETKFFIQVNHPDNLSEVCKLAKKVVCESDALSELLVDVHLDIYINRTTSSVKARDQGKEEKTCYAFACAVVLHLAMQRIHGREGGHPSFDALKDEMIREHGKNRAKTEEVLAKICPEYGLHYQKASIEEAKKAISEKRPVVATFYLTDDEWDTFENFYEKNPAGILTHHELDVRKRADTSLSGHAVVLTSYNSKCLTFMNSWGDEWADNGFFRVQNAEVLGDQLEFFDVYWELDDLNENEKERYRKFGSILARKLIELLEGLEFAEYTCPKCQQISLVTEFTGTLSKVQCPKCSNTFSTKDNAGNILALNIYLTSLSR